MIEIGRLERLPVVAVRLHGTALTSEFMEIPASLTEICRREPCRNVLFSWSEVESWCFSADEPKAAQTWIDVGRLVERAAIVHHHRLNRQAAWLGAALRLGGSQVRSYRPAKYGDALSWLTPIPNAAPSPR